MLFLPEIGHSKSIEWIYPPERMCKMKHNWNERKKKHERPTYSSCHVKTPWCLIFLLFLLFFWYFQQNTVEMSWIHYFMFLYIFKLSWLCRLFKSYVHLCLSATSRTQLNSSRNAMNNSHWSEHHNFFFSFRCAYFHFPFSIFDVNSNARKVYISFNRNFTLWHFAWVIQKFKV